jgi:hypothetical protein
VKETLLPTADIDLAATPESAVRRAQDAPESSGMRPYLIGSALALLALASILVLLPWPMKPISTLFFKADLPWLINGSVFLLLLSVVPGSRWATALLDAGARRIAAATTVLAGAVLIIGLVGTFVVCRDYALSRDEAMAAFDATILAHGRLIAPVPTPWRAFANALEPLFLLPVRDNAGWVSSYLPGNAAIRAMFAVLATPALASPAMASLAIVAQIAVARRLWPERPDAAIVAGLLLVSSSQVLVTAMTPYAMTAHLALNLVWLWLFLRDSKWSHLAALLTGVLATGLHQLIFHPLFVMPFVVSLWVKGRLRLAATYTVAYGFIVLGWIAYWQIMLHANHMEGAYVTEASAFAGRVWDLIRVFDFGGIELMLRNIARFITWQNGLLLPLTIAACASVRAMPQTVILAGIGVIATLGLVFLVLPFQGHGWGYRYLHGVIGSCVLVATQGWVVLTTAISDNTKRRIATQFVVAAVVSTLVVFPMRGHEAARFLAPFAKAEDLIVHADSDVVFVDPSEILYAPDLVRNDPFLRNRPMVFDLWSLSDTQVRALCTTNDVAIFDKTDGKALGFPLLSERYVGPDHRQIMRRMGCGRPIRRRAGS